MDRPRENHPVLAAAGPGDLWLVVVDVRDKTMTGRASSSAIGVVPAGAEDTQATQDVTAGTGRALTEAVSRCLRPALSAKGFGVTPVLVPPREDAGATLASLRPFEAWTAVVVELREWSYEVRTATRFDYDVVVTVVQRGAEVAKSAARGTCDLGAGVTTEAVVARIFAWLERELMPMFPAIAHVEDTVALLPSSHVKGTEERLPQAP